MSTGMDANVVTRPLIILAAKWQMMLSWKYTVCVCACVCVCVWEGRGRHGG